MIEEISATELKRRLDAGEDIQLIDVRQPDEYAFAKIEGAKLIPLGEVIRRMGEIDESRETVIHCKMGGRSGRAIEALQQAGFKGELKNLKGGITAWSNEVILRFRSTEPKGRVFRVCRSPCPVASLCPMA